MDATPGALPLGVMRQAVMKLDSFITDMAECMEDEDIDDYDRQSFCVLKETAANMEATLVNVAMKEISEEDFLAEEPEMDPIDPAPGEVDDIMDEEL